MRSSRNAHEAVSATGSTDEKSRRAIHHRHVAFEKATNKDSVSNFEGISCETSLLGGGRPPKAIPEKKPRSCSDSGRGPDDRNLMGVRSKLGVSRACNEF